jgi:glycosyltransferase involved in cell wall biosynthesis
MLHDKPAGGGGIRRHVDDSTEILRAAGHRVRLLRLTPPGEVAGGSDDLVFPRTFDPIAGRGRRAEFRRLLSSIAPRLIHVHAGFTSLSAVLLRDLAARYPTVGQFHDVGSFCYHGTRRFMSGDALCGRRVGIGCWTTGCYRPSGPASLLRGAAQSVIKADLLAAWRQLPRIVMPSRYLQDVAALHGFPSDRLRVVSNICVPAPPGGDAVSSPPLILFVGSLLRAKGAHLALDALALVADRAWRAVLVGEGPERGSLEAQVRRLGLADRVELPGALDRAGLDGLYRNCSMLVHASTMPESFGLVGVEAMGHGKPVAGFNLGGVGEWLVDGETGLAAGPWSVGDLAGAIRRLLDDPALAVRLGQAAQMRVRDRFSPPRFLAATLAVYAEAIDLWQGDPRR